METKTDFRILLQRTLIERCEANPRYSLRAFARFLQVDPSFLSKVLSRKRALTPKVITKVAQRLGLPPSSYEATSKTMPADYTQLTLDAFQVIADWYHYAILELVKLPRFNATHALIAKALGISVHEVRAAVERLLRLEMLEEHPTRGLSCTGAHTTVAHDLTSGALRKHQKQVLEQAIRALEEVPYEKRDQSSMTMAIDSKRVKEAKKRIQNFRRELCAYLQNGGRADQVYQLGISLFPITKLE